MRVREKSGVTAPALFSCEVLHAVHHIIQRGNERREVFFSPDYRDVALVLLRCTSGDRQPFRRRREKVSVPGALWRGKPR